MKFLLIFSTIYYSIFFIIATVLTPVLFIPYWVLNIFQMKKSAKKYMAFLTTFQARVYLKAAFVRKKVVGIENLPPESENVCLVANHQSYMDALVIASTIPYLIGFVTKKELFRVPFLRTWMIGAGSIPIDRGNPRSAIKAINEGAEMIKNGNHVIIFPEGTRSQSNGIREFKKGSLKLAYKAEAKIVPITVDGNFRVFEENNMISLFRKVTITIHPAIETKDMPREERTDLNMKLWGIINSGLENPNEAPKEQFKVAKKKINK